MKTVNIDRLEIRLKSISPQAAVTLVDGLGNELMKQVTKQQDFMKQKRTININKIESGSFRAERGTSYSEWQRLVAGRIVESIKSKIK